MAEVIGGGSDINEWCGGKGILDANCCCCCCCGGGGGGCVNGGLNGGIITFGVLFDPLFRLGIGSLMFCCRL